MRSGCPIPTGDLGGKLADPGVPRREVAHVAVIAFEERLPERDYVQVDNGTMTSAGRAGASVRSSLAVEGRRVGVPVDRIDVEGAHRLDPCPVADLGRPIIWLRIRWLGVRVPPSAPHLADEHAGQRLAYRRSTL